ncbi:MAG: urea carboxylase-associated family protein [Candidatus Eremiobacteraeota bacterium]|nr:urea carboxylase-associated family protein [Candidatus Eremiobacteraeota bacterium]
MEVSVSALTLERLHPQTGTSFVLERGQSLHIASPTGKQVADVAVFSRDDPRESFSAGRTLDYNASIYISTGDALYSNRSEVMLAIVKDDVGRHDYLLTPCSEKMFELLRGRYGHPSCHGNLAGALAGFGIQPDAINATFNAFMSVRIDSEGEVHIEPPRSKAGDEIVLRAEMNLIVGLTACSSEHTNAGECKPIDYCIT